MGSSTECCRLPVYIFSVQLYGRGRLHVDVCTRKITVYVVRRYVHTSDSQVAAVRQTSAAWPTAGLALCNHFWHIHMDTDTNNIDRSNTTLTEKSLLSLLPGPAKNSRQTDKVQPPLTP